LSTESASDKTPMELSARSVVYSGVRKCSWLPYKARMAFTPTLVGEAGRSFLLVSRMPLEVIYFCTKKNNEY